MGEIAKLYDVALRADEAYGAELRRLYGKKASTVRYTQEGNGEPGSVLRALAVAKEAADERLHVAIVNGKASA